MPVTTRAQTRSREDSENTSTTKKRNRDGTFRQQDPDLNSEDDSAAAVRHRQDVNEEDVSMMDLDEPEDGEPGNPSESPNLPIQEGQRVSWKWGTSHPEGTVSKIVEDGSAQVTSNKGNTITRNAKPGDPAVKITRSGNDVVKLAHELDQVMET